MSKPKLRQRITDAAVTVGHKAARFQRPKVTQVLCEPCGRWVKPREFEPRMYACTTCAPGIAHALYRIQRDAAQITTAAQRAYEKELHAWRRQLASVNR
ncbi:MAG: hypothetical protein HOV77_32025 [Hamadaea sp.]|uniref:hypothetical protein n=1 Tax=Hamadaea sp. TaxID=2024425 RepID=UPI001793C2DA|nr:hypothetical protein [Hamadaea sp.]NUT23816.1 hypothetical protein [Hamadaea sp.]